MQQTRTEHVSETLTRKDFWTALVFNLPLMFNILLGLQLPRQVSSK